MSQLVINYLVCVCLNEAMSEVEYNSHERGEITLLTLFNERTLFDTEEFICYETSRDENPCLSHGEIDYEIMLSYVYGPTDKIAKHFRSAVYYIVKA